MKKTISIILCIFMMLSMTTAVFASNITTDGGTNETLVTYGMNEGFIVVIPNDFNIDNTLKSTANVLAMNVMIPANKKLDVTVSGDNYVDSWELINESAIDDTLTYTIGSTEGASDIINGSVVLSVKAGEAYDSTVTETMYFTITGDIARSGNYSDTLTFTAEIKNAAIRYELVALEDILDDDGNAFLYVGQQTQLEAVAYYSVETPTWKSSDPSVAKIDSNGVVTAVSPGTAIITYTYDDVSGNLRFNVDVEYTSFNATYANRSQWTSSTDKNNFVIPATFTYDGVNYKVTSVSDFRNYYVIVHTMSLPDTITRIESGAFYNSYTTGGLQSIKMSKNLQYIGSQAFYNCAFTTIEIPKTVTYIGSQVFKGCRNLHTIYYEGTQAEWDAITKENDALENYSHTWNSKGQIIYNSTM